MKPGSEPSTLEPEELVMLLARIAAGTMTAEEGKAEHRRINALRRGHGKVAADRGREGEGQ